MTTATLVQALILGLAALVALVFAVRRLLPGTSRRALSGLAARLEAPARSRFSHWLADRLRPAGNGAGGCGSGDGCGSCGGCGTPAASKPVGDAQPLHFTRKSPEPSNRIARPDAHQSGSGRPTLAP